MNEFIYSTFFSSNCRCKNCKPDNFDTLWAGLLVIYDLNRAF